MRKNPIYFYRLILDESSAQESLRVVDHRRSFWAGSHFKNDLVLHSPGVPSRFELIQFQKVHVIISVPDDESKKIVSTKIQGSSKFKIGERQFRLEKVSRLVGAPEQRSLDRIGLSFWTVALLLTLFLQVGVAMIPITPQSAINSEPVSASALTDLAKIEKIFEREKAPPPPLEEPKKAKKIVAAKKAQKNIQVASKLPRKRPMSAASGVKNKGSNLSTMGFMAVQGFAGSTSTVKVANAGLVAQVASAQDIGFGLADVGIGSGREAKGSLAGVGSFSGKDYAGGLKTQVGDSLSDSPEIHRREIEVRGGLDPEVIRRIVEERLPELRFCFEKELLTQPQLGGKVLARWVIQPEGSVSQLETESQKIAAQILHPCLQSRILKWKFPKPEGGGIVRVKYPFYFAKR